MQSFCKVTFTLQRRCAVASFHNFFCEFLFLFLIKKQKVEIFSPYRYRRLDYLGISGVKRQLKWITHFIFCFLVSSMYFGHAHGYFFSGREPSGSYFQMLWVINTWINSESTVCAHRAAMQVNVIFTCCETTSKTLSKINL